MNKKIKLLDCTLRDGAYIVDSQFGIPAIRGIIKKLQEANVDIIECGWLKNMEYKNGSTFYHYPKDLEQYVIKRNKRSLIVVMIDWNRYDVYNLPEYDGKSIDAIRVVFPYEKYIEGIEVGKIIRKKGYQVFYQAANTLAYSNEDLIDLSNRINKESPLGLSIVDTFGAMYEDDLTRIVNVLDKNVDPQIALGFHSHNNQQLSFSLTMQFIKQLIDGRHEIIVDASLCGMGRGAGNATTELVSNYINQKYSGNYNLDNIMDAIDMYIEYFKNNYFWGYSTSHFIAGMYCCHVNNIAYLQNNHRINAKDLRNIIESLSPEDRKKYDYNLLEEKYIENQDRIVDDKLELDLLEKRFCGKEILLLAPGKTLVKEKNLIMEYIKKNAPITIAVNAFVNDYNYDYFFVINSVRYDYAKDVYSDKFNNTPKIVLSNIKTEKNADEIIINFNHIIKRGWPHFDNAVINCIRLLDILHVTDVTIAGFDGFKQHYNESYADPTIPSINNDDAWDKLNEEIKDMYLDLKETIQDVMNIKFLTKSIFDV